MCIRDRPVLYVGEQNKIKIIANIQMELIKCCKELMIREPFYGLFLLNLNKEISDTYVDTACVSRNGVNSKLVINPNY